MLSTPGGKEQRALLRMETDKVEGRKLVPGSALRVSVAPENVMLLRK